MSVQLYTPHIALQDLVNFYFLMHIKVENGQPPISCPYPPTPQQCIIFYMDDEVQARKEGEDKFQTKSRCVVVGPQVTRVNLLIRKSHKAFMVGFQPGGLYQLLGVPMTHMFDDGFDGLDLIGSDIKSIIQQLQDSGSFDDMRIIVENFLLAKLSGLKAKLPLDLALKELVRHDGNLPIDTIASLSCLSLRQFERKCHERIGLSPKMFSRLARFSKAYRLRESNPDLTWTYIAHAAGYYDQMHFIRDFKEFAGVVPSLLENQLALNPFRMQAEIKI